MIEETLMDSKYHLAVSKRLYESYLKFQDKRFIIAIINELARSASNIIKTYLLYEGVGGKDPKANLRLFVEKIAPKYLDPLTIENLLKILEIEKAQKNSPIEFAKKDKLILLINGKYRIITVERLNEFMNSAKVATDRFPLNFRQI
ncbi:MAG: hypothetical protein NUV37_03135 [Nanoarchaeota archaeon]|nr:hypothetical protein [Nanoarchaeota archaeon]